MKLVEAKQAVQQKNSTTFVIPFGSQHEIEKMLVKEEHFEGDLIKVSVEKAEYNEQIITLGFHYGAKTYRYCYRVSKGNIIPLWSSFSSLGKDSHTTYISNSK